MLHLTRATVKALLLLALVAAATLALAPPAVAAPPAILSPAPGATVVTGWAGPVEVDLGEESHEFELTVTDSEGYYYETTYLSGSGYQAVSLPAVTRPGAYTITLSSYDGGTYESHDFTVSPGALTVKDVSISPETFYPLVRDGYRDSTRLRFWINKRAGVTATVRHADGTVVRRLDAGAQDRGWAGVTWDGRNAGGTMTRTGGYRITATVRASTGEVRTASRVTSIATAIVTRTASKSRWGDQGSPATSGSCYITRDAYEGSAELDCWGGRYARMSYGFRIPSNARDLRFSVSGERSGADLCCKGVISKAASRPSSTAYRVTVKATGTRAYSIYRVRISYAYRTRI